MIQHLDVDQIQRRLQRLRQQLIGARGFGDPRRMVVRKNHRGAVVVKRLLDDLARIDARLRQRAAKELLRRDQPVLRIEEEHVKDFVRQPCKRQPQVFLNRSRRVECASRAEFFVQRATRELDHRVKLRELRVAQPLDATKLVERRGEQRRQPAESRDDLTPEIDCALAGDSGAKEDRQQFGFR